MGQRSFFSTGSNRDSRNSILKVDEEGHFFFNGQYIPSEPVDITPVPLSAAEALHSQTSWLSRTESALTHEWQIGRKNQQLGVISTSPHVPLTCAAVEFPANRSSGNLYTTKDSAEVTEIPVGKDFFLALRSFWRMESKEEKERQSPHSFDSSDFDDSFIIDNLDNPVGPVMDPPVPLSYMVTEVLVPQWQGCGMYTTATARKNC